MMRALLRVPSSLFVRREPLSVIREPMDKHTDYVRDPGDEVSRSHDSGAYA
jgi:hypothetical protein